MWSPVKTSIHTRFLHSAFTRSSCRVVNGQPMKSFHYSVQLFRLTSMKKKCIASAVEPWGNIADELTKSSSRFNSRPDYEQVWSSGIPALYLSRPSIILYKPAESSLFSIATAGGIQIQWKVQYTRIIVWRTEFIQQLLNKASRAFILYLGYGHILYICIYISYIATMTSLHYQFTGVEIKVNKVNFILISFIIQW